MGRLDFSPLGLVAPSELGARLEVLGGRGTVGKVVTLLFIVCQASSRAVEESGHGAVGVTTDVQQFAGVLR